MKQKVTITLNDKVLKNIDSIVDRLYIRNRSQAVEFLVEKSLGENKTAVIFATGPSERLRVSKDEYRVTARVGNTTVVELAIKNLRENGFKKIFIIGEQAVLTSIFSIVGDGKRYGANVTFVEDKNPPGTAESLRLLKGELKSTFLAIFGDIIFSRMDINKLWKHHFRHRGIATVMVTDSSLVKGGKVIPVKKNALNIEGDMVIKAYQKNKSFSLRNVVEPTFVFSAIFVAEPEIFSYMGDSIENDILPVLADKQLLYGYVSSVGEIHIHTKEDVPIAIRGLLAHDVS
jgi:NDP-sugar pyrophosphorylase family protein